MQFLAENTATKSKGNKSKGLIDNLQDDRRRCLLVDFEFPLSPACFTEEVKVEDGTLSLSLARAM